MATATDLILEAGRNEDRRQDQRTMLETMNKLIEGLPDLHLLLRPHLITTVLPKGRTIYLPDQEFGSVYLIETGIASLVCGESPAALHVAVIGPEGMLGTGAWLSNPTALFQPVASTDITALELPTAVFDAALNQSPELRSRFLQFSLAVIRQIGETAQANARLKVEQRLARWITLAADRLGSANIPATHEDLAASIGCRRAGVTIALHVLEGEKMIRSSRARVQVLDGERLRMFADEPLKTAKRGRARPAPRGVEPA